MMEEEPWLPLLRCRAFLPWRIFCWLGWYWSPETWPRRGQWSALGLRGEVRGLEAWGGGGVGEGRDSGGSEGTQELWDHALSAR